VILEVSKLLKLGPSDAILDIGVNIGAVSLPVAFSLGVEVVGIEASGNNAALFLKNVDLNSVKSQLHRAAVVSPEYADSNRYVTLYENNGNRGASSLYEEWNPSLLSHSETYAPTETLDKLLAGVPQNLIKLVKIDIEGSEFEALKGFQLLHKMNAPVVFEHRIDVGSREVVASTKNFAKSLASNFDLFGIDFLDNELVFVKFDIEMPFENAIGIPSKTSEKLRIMRPKLFA
jgi:FkbM family methyltransferase